MHGHLSVELVLMFAAHKNISMSAWKQIFNIASLQK